MAELEHLNGTPWYSAPVPRRMHRCWAQTAGVISASERTLATAITRCACGAVSMDGGPWTGRNSRAQHKAAKALTRLTRTLKQPWGEDFPPLISWFMILMMLVFFAGIIRLFPTVNTAICQQVVCP